MTLFLLGFIIKCHLIIFFARSAMCFNQQYKTVCLKEELPVAAGQTCTELWKTLSLHFFCCCYFKNWADTKCKYLQRVPLLFLALEYTF